MWPHCGQEAADKEHSLEQSGQGNKLGLDEVPILDELPESNSAPLAVSLWELFDSLITSNETLQRLHTSAVTKFTSPQ